MKERINKKTMKKLDSILSFIISVASILLSWKKKKKCTDSVDHFYTIGCLCPACRQYRCICNHPPPLDTALAG